MADAQQFILLFSGDLFRLRVGVIVRPDLLFFTAAEAV
jgi:hypothetical protein